MIRSGKDSGGLDWIRTRAVNGNYKETGGKLQLTYQCNRKSEAPINHDVPLQSLLLQVGGKASSTIVLPKCSVDDIKPITVVDFDNQNSTGSLGS